MHLSSPSAKRYTVRFGSGSHLASGTFLPPFLNPPSNSLKIPALIYAPRRNARKSAKDLAIIPQSAKLSLQNTSRNPWVSLFFLSQKGEKTREVSFSQGMTITGAERPLGSYASDLPIMGRQSFVACSVCPRQIPIGKGRLYGGRCRECRTAALFPNR